MDRLRILIGADTYPPDVNGAARFTQRLAVAPSIYRRLTGTARAA